MSKPTIQRTENFHHKSSQQQLLQHHSKRLRNGNSTGNFEYGGQIAHARVGNMVWALGRLSAIVSCGIAGNVRLSKKGEVRNAVKIALQTGYTHIDCAHIYGNEDEIGQGIKDWGGDRKKIWVTSKVLSLGIGIGVCEL